MRFPVSAQDGIRALENAHTQSTLALSSLPKAALETVTMLAWLDIDLSPSQQVKCQPLPFSSPLSFARSAQSCSGLPSAQSCCGLPSVKSSSNLSAPLLCQAVDPLRCPQGLQVYLLFHFFRLRHGTQQI